jgi:uncharacterized membrane protein
MHSILFSVYRSLNNVYSGWILWNLFLAFIPLLMSFALFRRQSLSTTRFVVICFVLGFMGTVGTLLRTPRVVRLFVQRIEQVNFMSVATLLELLWLLLIVGLVSAMGIWLFKRDATLRTALWVVSFATFIAFLPNAPYVLTDIIHLIRGVSTQFIPTWIVVVVIIPLHISAIALAFEAYVISILNLCEYIKRRAGRGWVLPVELTIHALSALGIYLGRFLRLNSWDLVVDPGNVVLDTLNTLGSKRPLAVIVITFVMLATLYWVMKQITLGLWLRFYFVQQGIDLLDIPKLVFVSELTTEEGRSPKPSTEIFPDEG